jgi:predicted acylesterase/phospholipase RssA
VGIKMNPVPVRVAVVVATFVALHACTTLPRLAPVPPTQTARAVVPGFANCRYWLDEDFPALVREALADDKRERETLVRLGIATNPMPPAHVLAISGGGDAGAFAAGLLAGWSAQGTRPQFRLVTGVSAGALIAPFAYLGPSYDHVIRTVAISVGPNDIFDRRNALAGLASDGMADSRPLADLVAKYITQDTLAAIAAEYAKGRALQIATTDLDSGRPVIWNMGAIAASQAPGAIELFRKIMVASASIPGVVSPVLFDVEVDGQRYQEMHVDGGVIAQTYVYPRYIFKEWERATGQPFERALHVYVVLNGRMQPEWAATQRRTLAIGNRAIRTLVQAQGIADVDRIYAIALQDRADFNLAYIGPDFTYPHYEEFDNAFMKRLYDYAYALGASGKAWHKAPPSETNGKRGQ